MEEQKRNVPEGRIELLQCISEPLLKEIHFEVFMPILSSHPFFRLYSQVNPMLMQQACHKAVSKLRLSRGDALFTLGETSSHPRMYFVESGLMRYVHQLGTCVTLSRHAWA